MSEEQKEEKAETENQQEGTRQTQAIRASRKKTTQLNKAHLAATRMTVSKSEVKI